MRCCSRYCNGSANFWRTAESEYSFSFTLHNAMYWWMRRLLEHAFTELLWNACLRAARTGRRVSWRNKVLSLLLNMKVITQKEFANFRLKYPKGFNFHISEPEKNNLEQSRNHILENIGKDMVRTPLSEAKIT